MYCFRAFLTEGLEGQVWTDHGHSSSQYVTYTVHGHGHCWLPTWQTMYSWTNSIHTGIQ